MSDVSLISWLSQLLQLRNPCWLLVSLFGFPGISQSCWLWCVLVFCLAHMWDWLACSLREGIYPLFFLNISSHLGIFQNRGIAEISWSELARLQWPFASVVMGDVVRLCGLMRLSFSSWARTPFSSIIIGGMSLGWSFMVAVSLADDCENTDWK